MVTNLAQNYYLADNRYDSEKSFDLKLPHALNIDFTVVQLNNWRTEFEKHVNDKINKTWILDIDLDLFITNDPFRSALGEENFLELCGIFEEHGLINPIEEHSNLNVKELSHEEISAIQRVFAEKMENMRSKIKNPNTLTDADFKLKDLLKKTIGQPNLIEPDEKIDAEFIINAAETLILPHSPSRFSKNPASQQEVLQDFKYFDEILEFLCDENIFGPPKIITIAQSSDDQYCPENLVGDVKDLCFESLERNLGKERKLRVICDDFLVG